jgi:hypothetical protein
VGAVLAISLGAGGIGITHATTSSGEKPIYLPKEPCRIADLRPAPFQVGPRSAALGPAETYTLSGWGAVGECTLPTGTTGLALNVTAVGATQDTFLTFFPATATRPNASNLNPSPGQPPIPNAVNVDLDAAGEFSVYNLQGNVNVIIDVVGVYDDHNHDDRYYTEAEIDARPHTMFAVVNSSATPAIVRQSGGVSIASHSAGQNYWLTFPEDVTDCAFSATLGGPGVLDNLPAVLNHLGIAATQGTQGLFEVDVDEVAVSVYEQDTGDLVDSAFSVVVTCP